MNAALPTTSSAPRDGASLSVNALARPLVQRLLASADSLKLTVQRDASGACVVDAGIAAPGSVAAGLAVAAVCMGGLGQVRLRAAPEQGWPAWLEVSSAQPVLACLVSTTQVVARVLEVALHKAHQLGVALEHIVGGCASAPLPAPSPDGITAMGRTNDAILYGGRVQLTVRGDDEAARRLARQLPSINSPDHGRSFADIFREVDFDFYKIDGALFAPAEVWVSNVDSGNTWHAGRLDMALLTKLWLGEA